MKSSANEHGKEVMRNRRNRLAFIGSWLAVVALGLAGCVAGNAQSTPAQPLGGLMPPPSAPQSGAGLMLPPNPPGVFYGGDFVSLDEAAARVPFVIWLPDEAVVGAKLASVELNLPDNVLAVALHYDNGVVVAQDSSMLVRSMESIKQEPEQFLEVNGNPALGKEAGYTMTGLNGGKVPYQPSVIWYQDNVYRLVGGDDTFSMDKLLQIAQSMKPYTPPAQ